MSIFDVFTFKKEGKKIFSKENFRSILELAKAEIIKQAKANIPGIEKKYEVDKVVIARIESIKEGCNNKLIVFVLDKVIDAVPSITQAVYDFLKEKIENL